MIEANAPVQFGVALGDAFFYGEHKNSPFLHSRPMQMFLPDLREIGRLLGHAEDFIVLWDIDVARHGLVEHAVAFQIFAAAGAWYEIATAVRVHALGADGFIHRVLCFTDEPAPHWFVGRRFAASPQHPRWAKHDDFEWPYAMVRR